MLDLCLRIGVPPGFEILTLLRTKALQIQNLFRKRDKIHTDLVLQETAPLARDSLLGPTPGPSRAWDVLSAKLVQIDV